MTTTWPHVRTIEPDVTVQSVADDSRVRKWPCPVCGSPFHREHCQGGSARNNDFVGFVAIVLYAVTWLTR